MRLSVCHPRGHGLFLGHSEIFPSAPPPTDITEHLLRAGCSGYRSNKKDVVPILMELPVWNRVRYSTRSLQNGTAWGPDSCVPELEQLGRAPQDAWESTRQRREGRAFQTEGQAGTEASGGRQPDSYREMAKAREGGRRAEGPHGEKRGCSQAWRGLGPC